MSKVGWVVLGVVVAVVLCAPYTLQQLKKANADEKSVQGDELSEGEQAYADYLLNWHLEMNRGLPMRIGHELTLVEVMRTPDGDLIEMNIRIDTLEQYKSIEADQSTARDLIVRAISSTRYRDKLHMPGTKLTILLLSPDIHESFSITLDPSIEG